MIKIIYDKYVFKNELEVTNVTFCPFGLDRFVGYGCKSCSNFILINNKMNYVECKLTREDFCNKNYLGYLE